MTKDNWGVEINAGDTVSFSYGIPPIGVKGEVVQRGGSLIVLTPGHNPDECNLRSLRGHVGDFYKETETSVSNQDTPADDES